MRLWIDTDVGGNPDDSVALLCARAAPDVDFAGVSTTTAAAPVKAVIARALLDGLDPSVAVVAGGLGRAEAVIDAVAAAEPDVLLAIGPLTNVAALAAAGTLPPRVVVMGGAIEPVWHRGEWRSVESNFGADPGAAVAVVGGTHPGVRVLVVPLDVTVHLRLDDVAVAQLRRAHPVLANHVDAWLANNDSVVLHDPLALLAAIGHASVTTWPARLRVEPDGRLVMDEQGAEHDLAVAVDAAGARRALFALLGPDGTRRH